jgi:mannose-6-phosphate isomerase-like protein (cupin superfamily)
MIISHIDNTIKGWFVGNFENAAFKTDAFEAGYKVHKKGEIYEKHYHTKTTEINFIIRGKMKMQDKELNSGDVFIVEPYEISDPIFFEDTEVICIRYPGIVNDKISVEVINENI